MGVLPSVLKTANNYHPTSLLSNIEKKKLGKLVYNRITKFVNDNIILSTLFSLVFDIITLPTCLN